MGLPTPAAEEFACKQGNTAPFLPLVSYVLISISSSRIDTFHAKVKKAVNVTVIRSMLLRWLVFKSICCKSGEH